jgi:hypothetical protein
MIMPAAVGAIATSWKAGHGSLSFVRADSYAIYASSSLVPNGSTCTIAYFAKCTDNSATTVFVGMDKSIAVNGNYTMGIVNSGGQKQYTTSGPGGVQHFDGSLSLNTWYFQAWAQDGTDFTTTNNATAYGPYSHNGGGGGQNSRSFYIGDAPVFGNIRETGKVAAYAIWQGARLNATQLASYRAHVLAGNRCSTFNDPAPTTAWDMDAITGGVIKDRKGSYDLTVTNASIDLADRPW